VDLVKKNAEPCEKNFPARAETLLPVVQIICFHLANQLFVLLQFEGLACEIFSGVQAQSASAVKASGGCAECQG